MPTYPLSLPNELNVKKAYLRKIHAVARTQSPFTFVSQKQIHAGEKWILDLTFAPISGTVSTLTAWLTATYYTIGQQRSTGGVNYECTTGHTSGTFQTDFDAGKWKRIEVFAAIGFFQDLQGLEGTISLDLSAFDQSVSGETTVSFQLTGNAAPGYHSNGGLWYFDNLQLEEAL